MIKLEATQLTKYRILNLLLSRFFSFVGLLTLILLPPPLPPSPQCRPLGSYILTILTWGFIGFLFPLSVFFLISLAFLPQRHQFKLMDILLNYKSSPDELFLNKAKGKTLTRQIGRPSFKVEVELLGDFRDKLKKVRYFTQEKKVEHKFLWKKWCSTKEIKKIRFYFTEKPLDGLITILVF